MPFIGLIWGFIAPYFSTLLGLITGIDWTFKKFAVLVGICALLFSGYSLYNNGYKSCRDEVEKQANEKIKIKNNIRNTAIDRNVITDSLSKSNF
jgi:hypothetical protein